LDQDHRLKRLGFRAWHRGTREADYMIGGFFDTCSPGWGAREMDWFEALLDEDDVDVMAWAIGTQPVPDKWRGPLMERMMMLDFIEIPK
jgi:antitoxin CptB